MKQVTAYVAFGIFGDYDSNAPDTSTVCLVATEELAKEVCETLNEDPREHAVVFVDGWEHAKRCRFRTELVADENEAHTTHKAALAEVCNEDFLEGYYAEDNDEDEDNDGLGPMMGEGMAHHPE